MMVELFGPPGVGKTTFARALSTRLRESGHSVDLMLSYRPAEGQSPPIERPAANRVASVPRRLGRPFLEVLAIAGQPFALLPDIRTAVALLRILPPRSTTFGIRLSQYIVRLSHSWRRAATSGGIVLFDQAFVQLICSLVLLSRRVDESLIEDAMNIAPHSDLAIHLQAPTNILAARLEARKSGQGLFERVLELDINTNLKLIDIVDQLHRLLVDREQSIVCASSLDRQSLDEAVKSTEEILTAKLAASLPVTCRTKSHEVGRAGKSAA